VGRFVVPHPVRDLEANMAPIGRYREVVYIASANGIGPSLARNGHDVRVEGLGVRLRKTLEQAMRPFLEAELGQPADSIFAEFDWAPIAAASITQVYKARLQLGEDVIVKVQRPGLDAVVQRDAAALLQIAGLLERRTTLGLSLRPTDRASEFLDGLGEELDFTVEASNALALMAATPASLGVRIPVVHTDLSTRRVLVEERFTGVSIADVDELRRRGLDPDALADTFLRAMLHHIFDVGVFHADPHPGNVLVLDDGTIGLIDLGAVGRLGPAERDALVAMLLGVASGDAAQLRQGLVQAGVITADVDTVALDGAIGGFVQRHVTKGGGISSSAFQDLLPLLGEFGMRPPRWLATLGRTMVTLEGTLRAVSPSFSLVDSMQAIAGERVHDLERPGSLKEMVTNEAMV
jgi:ubiquinone biosynthesis protein